ncbi:MAG: glycosyltransferase [Clostridiales bacterium]|jgi:UDP:flavonoid glycosyltransferase YjiC (YdhE family)|nr:glycosyltransferase [Clostridiales bacterium]
MKILLISIGTRGDCEPFLGLSEMLRKRGEYVVCAFPEQYRCLAEESGVEFFSLGSEFLDLLNGEDAKTMLAAKGLGQISAQIRTSTAAIEVQKRLTDLTRDCILEKSPDIVIHHAKCFYIIPWSIKSGKRAILFAFQPASLHIVKGTPHIALPRWFPVALSYNIARAAFTQFAMMSVRRHFKDEITSKQVKDAIIGEPAMYGVSPSLFPQPDYWTEAQRVVGFWERDKSSNYRPPKEVTDFIETHKKILFVTFGSMTNSDPAGKTALFLDVLSELKIPAILNISGGGLAEPGNYDCTGFLFVKSIPYDWAYTRMYSVIHHGGAGTTHSALKAGCASMAIPHSADQPLFNKLIADIGAGPLGIPISKLTRGALKAKIGELWNNTQYKQKAEYIGRQMQNEDFADAVYKFIIDGTQKA